MVAALSEKVLPARERFRLVLAGLNRAALRKFGIEVVAAIRRAPILERVELLWLESMIHERCEEVSPSERLPGRSESGPSGWTGEGLWWEVWEAGQDEAYRHPESCRQRFGQLWREFGE